jgi:BMFP domain-containing protein YqiC
MPEPIATATIIALHGLATKLVESIQNGKDAAKAQEILRLVSTLQMEYFALQQQVIKAETENSQLRQRVASLESGQTRQPDEPEVVLELDEVAIRLLQHLSRCGHMAQTSDQLAQALGVTMTRARHYADTLARGKYIHDQYYMNGAVEFELNDRGREFLVAHNLDV